MQGSNCELISKRKQSCTTIETCPTPIIYISSYILLSCVVFAGLGVSDENLRKVCEYAECDDTCKLKVIVQNLLQEGMIKRAWNYLWTEDPYKKMMNEWKKLSWESLARAAEQLATNGCLFAQKIREFSGAGEKHCRWEGPCLHFFFCCCTGVGLLAALTNMLHIIM